jgi:hypothetical protein
MNDRSIGETGTERTSPAIGGPSSRTRPLSRRDAEQRTAVEDAIDDRLSPVGGCPPRCGAESL